MVKCSWSDSQGSSSDCFVFMYSYIEAAEAENTASVRYAIVRVVIHSHRDAQNIHDSYLNSIFVA